MAALLVAVWVLLRVYGTESRDPYLSERSWWVVITLAGRGFLIVAFTTPFSRRSLAVALPSSAVFVGGTVWAVRGVGRVRLLARLRTSSATVGTARAATGTVAGPSSGRACVYCSWRLDRDASGPHREGALFETVATGEVGGEFRIDDPNAARDGATVDVRGFTVLAAHEATVPHADWPDDSPYPPSVDQSASAVEDTEIRGVEQCVEPGDSVTVAPGVVYCSDRLAIRRAILRTAVTRVLPGGVVAAAGWLVLTTTRLPW